MKCRKRKDDVKTKEWWLPWDKSGSYLFTDLTASGIKNGMNCIEALMWNAGTCRFDDKGKSRSRNPTIEKVPKQSTGAD